MRAADREVGAAVPVDVPDGEGRTAARPGLSGRLHEADLGRVALERARRRGEGARRDDVHAGVRSGEDVDREVRRSVAGQLARGEPPARERVVRGAENRQVGRDLLQIELALELAARGAAVAVERVPVIAALAGLEHRVAAARAVARVARAVEVGVGLGGVRQVEAVVRRVGDAIGVAVEPELRAARRLAVTPPVDREEAQIGVGRERQRRGGVERRDARLADHRVAAVGAQVDRRRLVGRELHRDRRAAEQPARGGEGRDRRRRVGQRVAGRLGRERRETRRIAVRADEIVDEVPHVGREQGDLRFVAVRGERGVVQDARAAGDLRRAPRRGRRFERRVAALALERLEGRRGQRFARGLERLQCGEVALGRVDRREHDVGPRAQRAQVAAGQAEVPLLRASVARVEQNRAAHGPADRGRLGHRAQLERRHRRSRVAAGVEPRLQRGRDGPGLQVAGQDLVGRGIARSGLQRDLLEQRLRERAVRVEQRQVAAPDRGGQQEAVRGEVELGAERGGQRVAQAVARPPPGGVPRLGGEAAPDPGLVPGERDHRAGLRRLVDPRHDLVLGVGAARCGQPGARRRPGERRPGGRQLEPREEPGE